MDSLWVLTSAVQSHAPGARIVVLLQAATFNSLLGQDIAATEQHLVGMRRGIETSRKCLTALVTLEVRMGDLANLL